MLTAIEEKMRRERLIGFADAMRCLEWSGEWTALQLLIRENPEAYTFVPVGTRPNEDKPLAQAQIRYDGDMTGGVVRYWRPHTFNKADSEWMVPDVPRPA